MHYEVDWSLRAVRVRRGALRRLWCAFLVHDVVERLLFWRLRLRLRRLRSRLLSWLSLARGVHHVFNWLFSRLSSGSRRRRLRRWLWPRWLWPRWPRVLEADGLLRHVFKAREIWHQVVRWVGLAWLGRCRHKLQTNPKLIVLILDACEISPLSVRLAVVLLWPLHFPIVMVSLA